MNANRAKFLFQGKIAAAKQKAKLSDINIKTKQKDKKEK